LDAALLAAGGLALGLAVAPAGLGLLGRLDFLPDRSPYPIVVDGMTVLFAAAIAVAMLGALLASAAWMQRRRGYLQEVLKEAGNRQSGGKGVRLVRIALTVGQVALTITLLVSAGLLIRSAERVLNEDMGFDREHLSFAGVSLAADPVSYESVVREVFARVLKMPGVGGATLGECNPMGESGLSGTYQPVGTTDADTTRWPKISYCSNTLSNYFHVMGVPIQLGRAFTPEEADSGAPVAIVDQKFVRRYVADGRPLGRRITINVPTDYTAVSQYTTGTVTIVGVAANVKSLGAFVDADQPPSVYTPGKEGSLMLIRSSMPLPALTHALKATLREVSPPALLSGPVRIEDSLDGFVRARYPLNGMLVVLSVATLLLASVGLYAVLAYSVRMRTREFGIRLALGESGARLRRDVVMQGLRWAGLGAVIAVPLVWIVSRALASQLYGVSPLDPMTLLGVLWIVGVVSLVASWWPARAASSVEPMSVLRAE